MGKTKNIPWKKLFLDEVGEGSKLEKEENVDDVGTTADDVGTTPKRNPIFRQTRTPVEDVFYINPNDHANIQLVPLPLVGDNYHTWSKSIRRALGARNKLDFIDGNVPEPPPNSIYFNPWQAADYMVFLWIMNSISKYLVQSFQYIETSKLLWDEIKQRFDRSNGPKLFQLEKELMRCTQGNQTILAYFNSLNAIWDEMIMLAPIPLCTCITCKYGAVDEGRRNMESRKVMQFLLGLNDSFETVRSQVLMTDPLPNVSRVYSLVLQDEDQRRASIHSAIYADSAMFVGNPKAGSKFSKGSNSSFKPRLSKEERRRLRCVHCGEGGHDISECFKLHGIPDWFKKLKEIKKEQTMMVHGEELAGLQGAQKVSPAIKEEIERCLQMYKLQTDEKGKEENVNMIGSYVTPFDAFGGHFAFRVSECLS